METDKIPCIKYNQNLWLKIKPYLVEWGYTISYITSTWDYHTILVINDCNNLGICSNQTCNVTFRYNRELIDNIEEFLERAAKLKGFTYKRKDIKTNKNSFTKENLKPGMVIEYRDGQRALVIKANYNDKEQIILIDSTGFNLLSSYNDDLTMQNKFYNMCEYDIVKVFNSGNKFGLGFNIVNSKELKLIWQRKVIITKQEIADKFGININDIEINE